MCGRKTLTKNISSIVEELMIDNWAYPGFRPSYNIAPSQFNAVVIGDNNLRIAKKMRWGFEIDWKKTKNSTPIINARSETILKKPSFKNLVYSNRCIIISDGYFEWSRNDKQPYYIYHPEKKILPMAGLWKISSLYSNETISTYTIITTSAQKNISKIHHRMPVILKKEYINEWIFNEDNDIYKEIKYLGPYNNSLKSHTVSNLVNSPSYNNPNCIKKDSEQQTAMSF